MSTNGKAKPPLLAILICERIMMDEDGIATLMRVIDTFNIEAQTTGRPRNEVARMPIDLECQVFTRWGLGQGEFTEELALVLPDGKELPRQPVQFTKPAGFHFQHVRHNVRFAVRDSGIYQFRIYLDGQPMGEHPFRVNIERRSVPETA